MIIHFAVTFIGIITSGLVAYICFDRAHRPHDSPEPRMFPWRFMALLSVVIGLLFVSHLFNQFGVETGPDKSPFGRF